MKKKRLSPLIVIVLSFLGIIVVGVFLFKLPFSVQSGKFISWVDALFLSTSAVCVTGLSTIPDLAATLSVFGKVVLGLLIQIGGTGIVTIAIYVLVILGIKIGVTERYVLKEALNQHSISGMVRLVRSIIFTTLIIEFFGMIINFIVFIQDYSFLSALGISAFHSISSFNNAGFDILGNSSLQIYSSNWLLNINTMVQIVVGGIGFIVIQDVIKKKNWKSLSLYSKIVLKTTLFLIISGTILIKVLEYDSVTWLQAIFQSITTRTAGFSTIDLNLFSYTTIAIIMIFMFIGASPNSTGGGIKTTTFYVIFRSTISFLLGKPTIINNRRIEDDNRSKAFTLVLLAMSSIFVTFVIVSTIEMHNPRTDMSFIKVLFETISAFGTVGLSLGVTPYLYPASKVILSLLMFLGRLGPITIFGILNKNWGHPNVSSVSYATEKILVG
ncbi:MAG: potassium transporter TrkG [Candidatus Izemoplasmatales bacterium]|jgi:trk system potassium uptake protein TrkH|nr:potassium transporter TrkG [Candidatus Izemoplasmatales bacterium]